MGPTASLVTFRPVISRASGGPPTVTSPVYATVSPYASRSLFSYQTSRGALPPWRQCWQRVTAGHGQRCAAAPAEQPRQQVGGPSADDPRRRARLLRAEPERALGALRPDHAAGRVVPVGERLGDPGQGFEEEVIGPVAGRVTR